MMALTNQLFWILIWPLDWILERIKGWEERELKPEAHAIHLQQAFKISE